MRPPHLAVVLVMLMLVACGGVTADESAGAEVATPPAHDVAIVIPEAEDGRVAAGTVVEVVYPGGESRGIRHFLQRWDGQTWSDVYQIGISDAAQPYDQKLIVKAWASADEEFPVESIGFDGSGGGQFTVIPAPTEPGAYRICGDQPDTRLCSAAFDVS